MMAKKRAKKQEAVDETIGCTARGCLFHLESARGHICTHPARFSWVTPIFDQIPHDCPLPKHKTTVDVEKGVVVAKKPKR